MIYRNPFKSKRMLYCVLGLVLFSFQNSFSQEIFQIGGGGSNHLNITVTTSHNQGVEKGENLLSEVGLRPNLTSASRFLSQASFGGSYELIDSVSQIGFAEWIEQQFAIPYTFNYLDYVKDFRNRAFAGSTNPSEHHYFTRYFTSAWTYDAVNSPDILRARVALALSEIFVISNDDAGLRLRGQALANYYDILSQNAFGNYRDLLEKVALHPAMGVYLTHLNNPKSDTSENRFPDENFAREIMQLFSIGLVQLNQDGTPILDNEGNQIPTYDNNDIAELAKVFTGLTWGDTTIFGANPKSSFSFTVPMEMYDNWHEPGSKTIVNGFVIPDRNPVDGMADVQDALDHLFNHQNVAPFICHQLIQRLVTANPSLEYTKRVSEIFNNNGQDVRGDLKAVVRAILLDPEARDCRIINDDVAGKLREPVIRYAHLMRAFDMYTLGGEIRNNLSFLKAHTKQSPLSSPSVFNFFRPDFSPSGIIKDAGKLAPEFQIIDGNTLVGYANMLQEWLFNQYELIQLFRLWDGESQAPNFDGTQLYGHLDLSDEIALAKDETIGELVERLNLILAHGRLSFETKNKIIEVVKQLPDEWPADYSVRRVHLAIFLVMISPEYLIFK